MKHTLTLLLSITLLTTPCWAGQEVALKTAQDKISYSVGYQVGGDFKRQNLKLSTDALIKGIEDALGDGQPLLSAQEMQATLIELKKKIMVDEELKQAQTALKAREEGKAFLEQNAKKEGMIVLPSGLQYRVIKAGTGRQPTLKDRVKVHYRGARLSGQEFSSTYRNNKPDTLEAAQVIPGMQEALTLMQEGAKWELFIPAHLAFGERGPLEGSTVQYEVELLAVEPPK